MKLKIKKTIERATTPSYKHVGDACFDMSILIDTNSATPKTASDKGFVEAPDKVMNNGEVKISPNESVVFHTGLSFEIPDGYVMRVYVRSSTGIKRKLILTNSTGIIDSNYRGEVMVSLTNISNEDVVVSDGERVAQAEIAEVINVEMEEVETLSESNRGTDGFGSTGKK